MSKLQTQHPLRVLLVHPGTQHAPRLAATLERRGLLSRFWTGVARARDVGKGLGARGKRRVDIPGEKLRTIPWVEVMALLVARLSVNKEKLWHWRNGVFQKLISQREIEAADVVVGFDTSAWIIGRSARGRNLSSTKAWGIHCRGRKRCVRLVVMKKCGRRLLAQERAW